MGMFDSLYADRDKGHENEWQTKAYDCQLDEYFIGDAMPPLTPDLRDYQVAILGQTPAERFTNSFATVRAGVLVALHVDRDPALPLFNYSGHVVERGQSDPVHGKCRACGAVETRLDHPDGTVDLSDIGESATYPSDYGCELCS